MICTPKACTGWCSAWFSKVSSLHWPLKDEAVLPAQQVPCQHADEGADFGSSQNCISTKLSSCPNGGLTQDLIGSHQMQHHARLPLLGNVYHSSVELLEAHQLEIPGSCS